MSYPSTPPVQPAEFGSWRVPEPVVREPWITRRELRAAGILVGALVLLGALAGVLWQLWAPARPAAYVIAPGLIQPDETESFIAGDGRYAVIVAALGLLVGIAAYLVRSTRGPTMAVGLLIGGTLGGLATELTGYLLGGGASDGPTNSIIEHLKLHVHTGSLRLLEPMAALLSYSIAVSFAHRDDLGVNSDEQPVAALTVQ